MNTYQIIEKAIKGDEKSFIALVEARKEKLYRIAYSYAKNQHDALDIVQETIYKAFISIQKLKKPQYFDTWLIRITINCAIDHIKKSKQFINLNENKAIKDNTDQIEEFIDLHTALDKLEPHYKTIMILKCFEDLTFKDISKILDFPISTVKTHFYRALKHLKIYLKEDDIYE
ncbi:sigma-70 family RNA polymerase sigma factor [Crassaminicella thermophila]|uniref:sigma-70 family RNA polymerase sigma factor n=1 Tax=Crassaminicella thermophila TaxID=2599308 RepID=UPI001E4505A2|nr:sigma-70 family RNA polymerase sigma factor [Crassaminicella thermophila]